MLLEPLERLTDNPCRLQFRGQLLDKGSQTAVNTDIRRVPGEPLVGLRDGFCGVRMFWALSDEGKQGEAVRNITRVLV